MTPSSNAPSDAEGLVEKILFDHFYTGEPGQHEAIRSAAAALRAAPASGSGGGAMREGCGDTGVADHPLLKTAYAALAAAPQAQEVKEYEPFVFKYKNHRGEDAVRIVSPMGVRFGTTEWHKKPQWLMKAFDHEKRAEREFALADISNPAASPPSGDAVREAIARIIDPRNFEMNEISANQYTTDGIKEAMRKADAILASLPPRGDAVREALERIHSALDDALGDTDVTHIEGDEELRDEHPVQWAAQQLMKVLAAIPSSGAGR